jgi:hypothetical protein
MEEILMRLQAAWAALQAHEESDKQVADERRAALLTQCKEEDAKITTRDIGKAIGMAQSYVVHLLRYHRFLIATAIKMPEGRFRAYWKELHDPYENTSTQAKKEVYEHNMFEVIAQRVKDGIPPHKRVRKITKVTHTDLLKKAEPLRAFKKVVQEQYRPELDPIVEELVGLLHADRSGYAPSIIGGIAVRFRRKYNEMMKLMGPDE